MTGPTRQQKTPPHGAVNPGEITDAAALQCLFFAYYRANLRIVNTLFEIIESNIDFIDIAFDFIFRWPVFAVCQG